MSIQPNSGLAPLRGSSSTVGRLQLEGAEAAETLGSSRKFREPGTYAADGSFVFVRHPSSAELAASHRQLIAEIGPNVVTLDRLREVFAHNPLSWWILFRAADETRVGAEAIGFCGYLPLNEAGFAALNARTFTPRDPDLAHIVPRGEDPVALYLWGIVAHGLSDIAGKLVGHAIGLDLYETLPMFGTIGTEAGLAALRRSTKSASDAAALILGGIFEIKLPPRHLAHQREMRVWESVLDVPTEGRRDESRELGNLAVRLTLNPQ